MAVFMTVSSCDKQSLEGKIFSIFISILFVTTLLRMRQDLTVISKMTVNFQHFYRDLICYYVVAFDTGASVTERA